MKYLSVCGNYFSYTVKLEVNTFKLLPFYFLTDENKSIFFKYVKVLLIQYV